MKTLWKAKRSQAVLTAGAMMYDRDYLYVGGRLKDPTPIRNQYHFGGQVNASWNADALQIFLVASPDVRSDALTMTGRRMPDEEQQFVNYITLWYSTRDKKAGYFSFRTLGFKEPILNPPGVQGAWVKDEDGKGCAFEYRIPWKAIYATGPIKGGDAIQMLWQLHCGNDQGTELKTGLRFLADAGVTYGNTGGTRNAARAIWSDRTPEVGVNNDVPTECRLHPNGWGVLVLQ